MSMDYQNKVVVVTGAAGGLGSAMAEHFAKAGAKVAVCDLKGTEGVVSSILDQGGTAASYHFDVTDRTAVGEIMAQIKDTFGPIDLLVNNAGVNVGPDERKTIENFSDKWWDAIIKIDLEGVYNCSKHAVPYMNSDGSSIVNISSIVGMVPLRNQCAFTAAKAGVINLSKAMAMELADKGIRVNVVAPGTIGIAVTNQLWQKDSAMQGLLSHIPMGKQGTPQDIANAVMFLGSSMASYITGAVLPVDGGWTCGGFARNF